MIEKWNEMKQIGLCIMYNKFSTKHQINTNTKIIDNITQVIFLNRLIRSRIHIVIMHGTKPAEKCLNFQVYTIAFSDHQ